MKIPKHTYSNGEINYCQICGNKNLLNFLDLGYQPLADDLISVKISRRETLVYPIKVSFCRKCILVQNNYIVGDNRLYPKSYHYVPGITKDVVNNFKKLSNFLINKYFINHKSDLIIDLGCNDGSLLNEFKKKGCKKVIGIEPTDTIKIAKKKKIKTYQSFFGQKIANKVFKQNGGAKIITTTNVFAHTNNLRDFILGVKKLIKKDGIFVIENHYLLDVIKKLQFDTFYHEHLRTYSLTSLIKLMNYYGFNILDAYTSDRYGGNIQAHFTLKKTKKNLNIKKILDNEIRYGLKSEDTYIKFSKKIYEAKKKLTVFLKKKKNKYIVGKAFPARASILIHYFDILKTRLDYVAEQPISKKLNYYIPGTDIKIISSDKMKKKEPEYLIILAWHLFDAIHAKWSKIFKNRVKFVKILPKLKVF